jgi:hypothetical protein
MRGREIYSEVVKLRAAEHSFVKWWRKENDFVDYDLIDRFLANIDHAEEIGGLDLLTLDEMWEQVKRICGTRVKLERDSKGDRIEWARKRKDGIHNETCIYTPETVIHVFDVETKGNPVGT